jgi:hypothetical protein
MQTTENNDIGIRIAGVIGFLLVLVGMVNNIPSIPGLEKSIANIFNVDSVLIRKFPYQWLHPIAFTMMMVVTVLKHSFFRDAKTKYSGIQSYGYYHYKFSRVRCRAKKIS